MIDSDSRNRARDGEGEWDGSALMGECRSRPCGTEGGDELCLTATDCDRIIDDEGDGLGAEYSKGVRGLHNNRVGTGSHCLGKGDHARRGIDRDSCMSRGRSEAIDILATDIDTDKRSTR